MGLKRHDELEPQRPADFGRQVRYPSPNIEDLVVVEDLPIQPSKYKPLKYGTHHPDYDNNGLILVWQGPVKAANNQVKVRRVYATDQATPDDWHNYAIKFSGDAVANPIFIRSTIVLRKDYTPTDRGTTIADPNAGAPTGQVPTFNQPAGAMLVKEETTRLESDDQMLNSLFVRVHRVYEVLPGPWIPFTRYDDDLGPIQGRRRAVQNTGKEAVLAIGGKTTYEGREGSTFVSWEIEEAWDDSLFPEIYDDFYDDDRGSVQSVSRLVERTGLEVGTFIVSSGVATKSSYKGFNEFLVRQTIETWAVPGPIKVADEYDNARGPVQIARRLKEAIGSEVGSLNVTGGIATYTKYEPFNEEIVREVIETWAVPAVTLTTRTLGQKNVIPEKYRRLVVNVETNQQVPSDYSFPVALTGDQVYIELAEEAVALARLKIIEEIIDILAGPLVGEETNEEFGTLSITEAIVNEGTPADEGFLIVRSKVEPLGNGKSIKITASVASYAARASFLYDEETREHYHETRQIVPADTEPDPMPATGTIEEIRSMDDFKARRIVIVRDLPAANSSETAIEAERWQAYRFPGTYDIHGFTISASNRYHAAAADLIQMLIRTWWESSPTRPTIAISEILPDTVSVIEPDPTSGSDIVLRTYAGVLHNGGLIRGTLGLPGNQYGPTTPTFTEYTGIGDPVGVAGTSFTYTDGSPVVTIAGFGGGVSVGDLWNGTAIVLAVGGGSVTLDQVARTYPELGGETTYVAPAAYIRPVGASWIGTERVIGADVIPAREPGRWKIETRSVVMR